MRILWLCNIVLPELSEEFGFKKVQAGGWLSGMWEQLKKKKELELAVCVPVRDKNRMKDGEYYGYRYYSFQTIKKEEEIANGQCRFQEIVCDFRPDVVHIWGTEYLHSYAMLQACEEQGMLEHVLVHIQGLVSVYALHYRFGLPESVVKDSQYGCSIDDEIQDFIWRGQFEKKLLQKVFYVAGRTDWDRACCKQINPKINYYHCGEILRDIFYQSSVKWTVECCEKYSIFISQAGYPVKGFHLALDVLAELAKKYPKLHVYISGTDIGHIESTYGRYIQKKIEEYQLGEKLTFVGTLSPEEMEKYYRKANVFLSASVIENSSNSVCEAMHVGTPVVSSFVGGISSIITHGESGFLYPLDAGYMMQYYISQIFEEDSLAEQIAEKERERAAEYNHRDSIVEKIIEIYQIVKDGL